MTAVWGEITAQEIIPSITGELISGPEGSVLSGISTDSREIIPGQLFIALRGEKYDGHDFVEKAIEKGASCIIKEKGRQIEIPENSGIAIIVVPDTLRALGDLANWWRHQYNVIVAAITGSMGKTTTKEMTANILDLSARTLKNKGNFNNLIGLPLTLLRLEKGDRRAVLEMGMNLPGEIGRLTEISKPDVGLITNVARVHLEGLGDIMGVARAKSELLEKIAPESHVILNGDDDLLMKEASRFQREILTYGIGSGNDIRAAKIENLGYEGISFVLQYHKSSIPVRIRVPGLHNLFNALAASAIAICLKEPFGHIAKGLNNFDGIQGRFTVIPLPGDMVLVDDTYNSNPTSLKVSLDSVKTMAASRRGIVVGLGEMMELGDETVAAHQEVGGMVAELGASYFLAMGDHARDMITGALKKGFSLKKAIEVKSHHEMAQTIRDKTKNGDLILLKGSRRIGLEQVVRILKEERSEEDKNAQIEKDNGG
ncbi:UDP-N-acetylmuramoyl-tripeptide--D-alanyl-D-alanine ligase [Thermodesulfobacteriota bacterium]